MRLRILSAALLALIAALAASPGLGQSTTPRPRIYRLHRGSTYQHGCFPPCMCPMMLEVPLRGVFRLVPTGSAGGFLTFAVTDVTWVADLPSGPVKITGTGTYRLSALATTVHQQQLALDLVVGNDLIQRFDSGLVPATTDFPKIDVEISIHGQYCVDTVMRLHASPLLALSLTRSGATWDPIPDATGYDVVRGDLGPLHAGDLLAATRECLMSGGGGSSVSDSSVPLPGQGFWFAARSDFGASVDTYDETDVGQVGSRDPALQSAPNSCP